MENRSNHRQTLGQRGENLACRYLEGMGHTILERNWRNSHLEIDIISADPAGIHFQMCTLQRSLIEAETYLPRRFRVPAWRAIPELEPGKAPCPRLSALCQFPHAGTQ